MNDNTTQRKSAPGLVIKLASLYRRRPALFIGAAIVLAFLLGLAFGGNGESMSDSSEHTAHAGADAGARIWTCSMHPQIQLPKPGKCPICFMDLIPVEQGTGGDEGPRELAMTDAARKLAQIVTVPAERRYVTTEIRMVGKIEYNESLLRTVTARFPGRMDRLFVDYTGMSIRRGEHLVEIYSPELLAAQQELVQAVHAYNRAQGKGTTVETTARLTLEAAREKLRLWELKPEQIRDIESKGITSDRLTVYSPITGIVMRKHVREGDYVKTGAPLYSIADLSELWLLLDAYESDLTWLRYGQQVEFTTEAYPGVTFNGTIAFIDPILNAKTRTVKIRVNVANSDGRLKPEMFVRAVVKADIAAGGRVMDASLAGKWICPMHPEVVADKAGQCTICGMPLVTTESLGYVPAMADTSAPLAIPATAPLITGERAVVYVELPDRERPTFEGREVVLGPRAGDYYVVTSGLQEGEKVVVNGAFKIDSELQLRGKYSMMNPPPAKSSDPSQRDVVPFAVGESFLGQLADVYAEYFKLQEDMAGDSLEGGRRALQQLSRNVSRIKTELLSGAAREQWSAIVTQVQDAAEKGQQAARLADLRIAFEDASKAVIDTEQHFGHKDGSPHFLIFCPMAFDNTGAYWLQDHDKVTNPYFGASMLRCGSVKASYDARASHDAKKQQ